MTKHTISVPCHHCEGAGEVTDDDQRTVVCAHCLGQKFVEVNPDAPACDVVTHEEVTP